MELAVNYSPTAANLVAAKRIDFDRFKCPAWPDLIASMPASRPIYVHFPLMIGKGLGDAFDTETKQVADWDRILALRASTSTPLINLHLESLALDHPDIPRDSVAPDHVERVITTLVRDARAVMARVGAENVIVENLYDLGGKSLRASYLPDVIRRVVEEAGCGFLFDVSHARLAARSLGVDAREYIARLPTTRTREIHITGIQPIDAAFLATVRHAGLPTERWERYGLGAVDHMAFADEDWAFAAWAFDRIRTGVWSQPWIVSLEYGGLGKFWQAFSDARVLEDVVPRLNALVRSVNRGNRSAG